MKNIGFKIFFLLFLKLSLSGATFNFTPIKINLTSLELNKDTIVAYGEYGSALISRNNSRTWEQVKIFKSGWINHIFINMEEWLAFNENGEIKSSSDGGKSWTTKNNLNDSLIAVIKTDSGYFVRMRNSIRILANDLKTIKSKFLKSIYVDVIYRLKITKSIAYFNDLYIIGIDSSDFAIYNKNLDYIDKISFEEMGFCKPCFSSYQLDVNSGYLYMKVRDTIFRTKDFKSIERYYNCSNYVLQYKFYKNELYIDESANYQPYFGGEFNISISKVINPDSAVIIARFNSKAVTNNIYINEFSINNGNIIMVGDSRFISINKTSDSALKIVCDLTGASLHSFPDKINDSTYLLFAGYYDNEYQNFFYRTDDSGITYKTTVDPYANPDFKKYNTLMYKFFDKNSTNIYLGGSNRYKRNGSFLISNDTGKNFRIVSIPFMNFYSSWQPPYRPYLTNFPNLQKSGDNFILAQSLVPFNKCYTYLYTFNKDFEKISEIIDSNNVFDYFIESKDTNNFLVHCLNLIDSTYEIKYTSDKFMNWQVIKKYPLTDSMLYLKEFDAFGKRYFALAYFRRSDSICTFDLLDIETKKIQEIYNYKIKTFEYVSLIKNGICGDSNTIYLSVKDTLFFIKKLNERSSWDYLLYPNHGLVIRTFTKFNERFFARYSDDLNPDNIFWFTITDTAKEVPEPIILTEDLDFGKKDIKSTDSASWIIKIYNQSKETDLRIYGYSLPDKNIFKCELPKVDSIKFLSILRDSSYQFSIFFQPKLKQIYLDSIIFYSNATVTKSMSYLKGEGIDTTSDINVIDELNLSYFYSYPPFPIPAKRQIRSQIYWDSCSDIDTDEISVFNVNGEKICGREKISIEKSNFYSGYLVWDCSSYDNGIYLIKIQHGTTSQVIKVMVAK